MKSFEIVEALLSEVSRYPENDTSHSFHVMKAAT
jgi:hypothetical protein